MKESITVIDKSLAGEVAEVGPDKLLSGEPITRVTNYFSDSTQQFHAGRWSATRGKWRVTYTENELCVMTSGKVVIESRTGERNTFATGDVFVIPAGFSGSWEVVEDCSKIYAIFEASSH